MQRPFCDTLDLNPKSILIPASIPTDHDLFSNYNFTVDRLAVLLQSHFIAGSLSLA